MEKLSIVIPVYFNEDSLYPLYEDLKDKVLNKLECDYEIIMVDDGSKDHSYEKMKEISEIDANVKLVKLSRNFGEHAATLAGIAESSGSAAVRKAADLQEPSEMILEMYKKYKEGSKVVLAIREDREEPRVQKLFSSVYCGIMRKFAFTDMPKGGFDTFLISRQIIDLLVEIGEKNAPLTEEILWTGFDAAKVYYVRKKRTIGKSGWTLSKKIKLAIDSLLSFSYMPIRLISTIGILSCTFSFTWAVIVFIQWLGGRITVEGWSTMVILMLMGFGLIMFTLGILGEYIWRMFDDVRNRPPYIIDERKRKADVRGITDGIDENDSR